MYPCNSFNVTAQAFCTVVVTSLVTLPGDKVTTGNADWIQKCSQNTHRENSFWGLFIEDGIRILMNFRELRGVAIM